MINLLENVREKVLVEPGLGSNKKWLALLLGLEVFLNRQEDLQFKKKGGEYFPVFSYDKRKIVWEKWNYHFSRITQRPCKESGCHIRLKAKMKSLKM